MKRRVRILPEVTNVNVTPDSTAMELAAQILSDSVASSLEFCLKEGIPGFQGCEATIRFLHVFNCLFDILNSRNLKSNGWKSPMQEKNYEMFETFLLEAKSYIVFKRICEW